MKGLLLALVAITLGSVYVGTAAPGKAALSIPTMIACPGTSVATSIEYRAHEAAVSALTFDLHYDPSVLAITPEIGSAAENADKVLFWNILPAPDGQAILRILIFGLNQTVIEDGSLVELAIEVSADSSPGPYSLEFLDVSLASPDAEAVPFKVHSGRVVSVGKP